MFDIFRIIPFPLVLADYNSVTEMVFFSNSNALAMQVYSLRKPTFGFFPFDRLLTDVFH